MSRGSDKQTLMRELGDEFRINQNLNEVFDDAAAGKLGLNRTDLRCMDIIQRLDGVTAGELAREAGLTTGAVTSVIDRLERAGYAKREADPKDRRKVLVKLTPAAFDAVYEIWGPETEEYMKRWSALPRAQLEAMIEFMRESNEIQRRHLERIQAEPAPKRRRAS
jgi:DNA-binding MarR family transcriptional regulator